MINWDDFENAVVNELKRDITLTSNPEQHRAIQAPLDQSLFLVAGPGSGKTTAIALRVLKLIFVDGIDPIEIIVTTFTKKAAAELRSRILGWGDLLRRSFFKNQTYQHLKEQLRQLDLSRLITGTLDSLSEVILGNYRTPGTSLPAVIEDFVSNALMIRFGLFNRGLHNNQSLKDYIIDLKGSSWGINLSEISSTLLKIKDRILHDQVDVDQFNNNSNHAGVQKACEAITNYNQELESRDLFDFARLEQEFLNCLQNETLNTFLQSIKFVLIDEYQDTNLLQEQIYFEMANATLKNGGSITIVGDDDQSLYRFRGATVDLFQTFKDRILDKLKIDPHIVYLSRNYRSTSVIVDFCNDFITLDQDFQTARVQNKPPITSMRSQPYLEYPILGMFRSNVEQLAQDLAQFIHRVIHGGGFQFRDRYGKLHTIRVDSLRGSPADIALLCYSPLEIRNRKQQLPLLLRNELNQLSPSIQVFNPRGQNLETTPEVQILCGLILECIDPQSNIQNSINLYQTARNNFNEWRARARAHINRNPSPTSPRSLKQFVDAWRKRIPLGRKAWEQEISLIDLVYKLVTWIRTMQEDVENLVYLEAITRTINQVGLFGKFRGQIIVDQNNSQLEQASVKEALWNIFMPIATGAIEINEELLETLPSDRLNIMSIHQAKGLEFPLVIVDVGSDFKMKHPKQAFRRFPENGGETCNLEDELRTYSPLGLSQRSSLNRAFDDLIRLYFEAYSRTQDVLLLVGLNTLRDRIPNIATGWDRNEIWHWRRGLLNLVHI